jgi:hypothetical protein
VAQLGEAAQDAAGAAAEFQDGAARRDRRMRYLGFAGRRE